MSPAAAFFQNIWVVVQDGVYQPADDTFLLCENLDIAPEEHMLELGTGCGLIAIVAAKAGARVVATDQSPLAVTNAEENVARHNLQDCIEIRRGHLFKPIHPDERFTLIVFNPPYLPSTRSDPAYNSAWSGGPNGRRLIDEFLTQCPQYLEAEGRLLLIQSSLSRLDQTRQILNQQFYESRVKAKKKFFFEQLLLFEAQKPRHRTVS